jgi:hypothetical protein
MESNFYINVNKIIERDSKTSTYKFALLRGVIDIIQDNSPYIELREGRAYFPTGLLIEKWLLYYYPIFDSPLLIPQINGETNLAFASQLRWLTDYYKDKGGFSSFFNDLKSKGIPKHIQENFLQLLKKLRDVITKMPMRYIGRSVNQDYYSIFQYENGKSISPNKEIGAKFIIESFGKFSIPAEYYEVFKLLGSFIIGQDSILFKWAEFSVNASDKQLSVEEVLNEVLRTPITEREINASKALYKNILNKRGVVYCVWSGDTISSYDIDHVIPFSIWKNNDLWNLLPARATLNNKKRDKIPSTELVQKRKELIVHYWELIYDYQSERFEKEIQVSLLGNHNFSNWQDAAFEQLKRSCHYLISTRGFEEWRM